MLWAYACRIFSALPVCHEHTLGAVPDGLEFAATAAPVAPMFTHTNLQEPPRHERNDFGRAGIRIGSGRKGGEPRRARSIRFSDSEWESVEIAASQRGMNAAEFARHAALGIASGRYGAEPGALPSQYADLIERIFRSTHILVTLKRDELMREGRGDELDELVRSTRELHESLLEIPQN